MYLTTTRNSCIWILWSNKNTWGGEFVPIDSGETVFLTDFDIKLDVPKLDLNTVFIVNGNLYVDETKDYDITLKNLIINKGNMYLGTETTPYTNKFTLTLSGTTDDPSFPVFGSKVLGIWEGTLDLHGTVRTPTWTQLASNAITGATSITLKEAVDWVTGEVIVIASSSYEAAECEQRTISSIDKSTPAAPVVHFIDALKIQALWNYRNLCRRRNSRL